MHNNLKEIEHLKSLWPIKVVNKQVKKVSRSPNKNIEIATYPAVIGNDNESKLDNEHWFFNVKFSFRDALDLKYEQRQKDNKSYMLWTQGPILDFKTGDTITSRDNKVSVQVQFASPMGWDSTKNSMFEGSVVYDEFKIEKVEYNKVNRIECTQMQFLELLIKGSIKD